MTNRMMEMPIQDYLCVDLETTGLNPKKDKIIEIGAVKVKNGQIVESFQTFVRPGQRLSEETKELTGISQEEVEGAPTIDEVLPDFLTFAEELPLLGHRILFDFSFLKKAAVNANQSFERSGIDTLKIARRCLPEEQSKTLSALCAYYEIPLNAHRALADAAATHELYQRLCRDFFAAEETREEFCPKPLFYKVKKEGPATKAQKERLMRLLLQHNLSTDYEIELLTKNEASRLIDRILATHGILQK